MDIAKQTAPTMLVILDGFGYREEQEGNAIVHANMSNWRYLWEHYPRTLLHASGGYVGLLDDVMGNSEVGHVTLGAGRIIPSYLRLFHEAIGSGIFFEHELLRRRFMQLHRDGKALHLMGLLSDGGVHSHEEHLYALLRLAKICGLHNVFIHAFLDGRDVAPQSADTHLQRLDDVINRLGCGTLVTMHGRFYAMDRDNNWERTQRSFDCLCECMLESEQLTWKDALAHSYEQGVFDEFLQPVRLSSQGCIEPGDGIVFFNFRPDRARQLTRACIDAQLSTISRKKCFLSGELHPWSFFITTCSYDDAFKGMGNESIFTRDEITHTLLDWICDQDKKAQVYVIAETEKYAHVTYFFHGMHEKVLERETRILVPSIKVPSYAVVPAMSARLITQHLQTALEQQSILMYVVNYANLDMVGHSGDFEAVVAACQVIDEQIGILYREVVEKRGGTIFFVGDHGNAEQMIGETITSHTTNPVPFVCVGPNNKTHNMSHVAAPQYGLSCVAATILKHLTFPLYEKIDKPFSF